MDLQLHASRARRAQARAAAGVGARHTNHGATWRAANAAHRSTLCGGIESVSWPLGCRASLCRRAGTSASPGHRAAGLTSTTCSPACTAAALTVGHAAPPCGWHGRSGKHYHSISCAFSHCSARGVSERPGRRRRERDARVCRPRRHAEGTPAGLSASAAPLPVGRAPMATVRHSAASAASIRRAVSRLAQHARAMHAARQHDIPHTAARFSARLRGRFG